MTDKTIFVVDDEPVVRKALKQSLESFGYRVVCFPDADLCGDALKTDKCSLVISDVSMPGKDGLTFLRESKEHHPSVPFIMISGYGDIPTAVACVQEGALDFLEKPLDEAELEPKIRAALQPKYQTSLPALTDIEQKVLSLVAQGKANKEIAFTLGKSVRTIENHRRRITVKLGASNSAEAVTLALQNGLLAAQKR